MRTIANVCLLVLAASAAVAGAQTVTDDDLVVETVATIPGGPQITTMAFLGPNDFLVLERTTGRVRRVTGGVVDETPVLDVAVNSESERGLLGIAINGEGPPKVFLYYTELPDPEGDGAPDLGDPVANRVYRYEWNPATGVLENPVLVLDLPVLPRAEPRRRDSMALDPATGFLWDTENGPASYDEVNRVPPGMNSGWEQIMGPDDRDPQGTGDLFDMPGAGSTYSDPEFSWEDTVAPTSIVFPWGSALGADYDGVALADDTALRIVDGDATLCGLTLR